MSTTFIESIERTQKPTVTCTGPPVGTRKTNINNMKVMTFSSFNKL